MRFVQFIFVAVIASGFLMSAHAQTGAHLEIVSATSMPLKVPPGEQEKILPASMLNLPSLGPYVKDAKKYKLTEFDLTKTGGKFFLASESVTTNIDNSPAAAKTFVDDNSNIVEEIVWVSDGRFHMLTFFT